MLLQIASASVGGRLRDVRDDAREVGAELADVAALGEVVPPAQGRDSPWSWIDAFTIRPLVQLLSESQSIGRPHERVEVLTANAVTSGVIFAGTTPIKGNDEVAFRTPAEGGEATVKPILRRRRTDRHEHQIAFVRHDRDRSIWT